MVTEIELGNNASDEMVRVKIWVANDLSSILNALSSSIWPIVWQLDALEGIEHKWFKKQISS